MRRLRFRDFASRCALRHSFLAFILVLAASAAHAGELKLNGSVTSTLVEILAGTTLSGTGTLGGDVTVAGVHAPGNSPGVMVIGGDLTYFAGTVVEWELEGNASELSDRGILFDGIDVGGNLEFTDTTTLSLVFNGSGSLVDWTDPFWSTDKMGTDGWLIYETAGTTTGLGNLVVSGTPWLDSVGNSFLDVLPGASFGVQQVGSDVYLTLVATVPEPSTLVLMAIGAGVMTFVARRRVRSTPA